MEIREAGLRKPSWIRVPAPSGPVWKRVSTTLGRHGLHTVCDGARCPNKGECWGTGTAAFMLMGEICTRSCRFCAVKTALRGQPLRKDEVPALVKAVSELGLRYVTLTSVDRDDLEDRGAGHFASCVSALKQNLPELKVEALIPDYTGAELDLILGAGPDVLAHNIETVPSLQNRVRDRRASFEKSLVVLREAKLRGRNLFTKTGLLLGLGESPDEVLTVMDTLRLAAVDLLTLGQYLRPTAVQLPVEEYLSPGQFGALKKEALARGFLAVTASPLARTSYHAGDFPRGAPHAL